MKFAPLSCVIATLFLMHPPSIVAEDACAHPRLISVTGAAEMSVPPDEVILTVGLQSRNSDLAVAKAQHDQRARKVIDEAQKAGIEAKYIQTSSIQMWPEYSEEKVPRLIAYQVTQTIQMTLKDLSKYESLVSRLIAGGVNRI